MESEGHVPCVQPSIKSKLRLMRDRTGMVIIWRRKRLITKLRVARGLAPIEDPNDLPDPKEAADYVSVSLFLDM